MERLKRIFSRLSELSSEENIEALKLLISEIRYILKHFKIRYLDGEVHIGMDDPYREGQILMLLSVLYPIYRDRVEVHPYFDREELSGELKVKGHLRLIHVLISSVRLLRNREIRKFLFSRDD